MKNMNQEIQLMRKALFVKPPITGLHLLCRRLLIALPLALGCLTLSPRVQAVTDGDIGNGSTAEGTRALGSLTSGSNDTAMGFQALFSNTTGTSNTATGFTALVFNTSGSENTANGLDALYTNTDGSLNTAPCFHPPLHHTTPTHNTPHLPTH